MTHAYPFDTQKRAEATTGSAPGDAMGPTSSGVGNEPDMHAMTHKESSPGSSLLLICVAALLTSTPASAACPPQCYSCTTCPDPDPYTCAPNCPPVTCTDCGDIEVTGTNNDDYLILCNTTYVEGGPPDAMPQLKVVMCTQEHIGWQVVAELGTGLSGNLHIYGLNGHDRLDINHGKLGAPYRYQIPSIFPADASQHGWNCGGTPGSYDFDPNEDIQCDPGFMHNGKTIALLGGQGDDDLWANAYSGTNGREAFYGEEGNDDITTEGSVPNNILIGWDGNDRLFDWGGDGDLLLGDRPDSSGVPGVDIVCDKGGVALMDCGGMTDSYYKEGGMMTGCEPPPIPLSSCHALFPPVCT